MNQEEREALKRRATQRIVASLQQTTNAEQMISSILNGYGIEMFAAGGRNTEEWIRRTLAGFANSYSHHAHYPRSLRRKCCLSLSLENT